MARQSDGMELCIIDELYGRIFAKARSRTERLGMILGCRLTALHVRLETRASKSYNRMRRFKTRSGDR